MICDITKEVRHLREIKDIRDELRMIQRVIEDQQTVLKKFLEAGVSKFVLDILSGLESRQRKSERLYSEAESVENSVRRSKDSPSAYLTLRN